MIRITRLPLPETTLASMAGLTGDIQQAAVPKKTADDLWGHTTVRRTVRPVLQRTLGDMAPGLERCMYCGDNQGTTIDHFEPVRVNPVRTFDWNNHLLACSLCNSHLKRDLFPTAADGTPLLIDPCGEDPAVHLHLSLAAGEYLALTDRGEETMKVFGLNRRILVRGRLRAYEATPGLLTRWSAATAAGDLPLAAARADLIWEQPLAEVVLAMFHQAVVPGAEDVFAGDHETLALLRDPVVRATLLRAG